MTASALTGRARICGFLALSLGLFVFYTLLDLREGGRGQDLLTTNLATPALYAEYFGSRYVWVAMVLNLLLALATAWLMLASWQAWRRRRARAGALCSTTAPLLLGFAFFGCPGCIVPLFGSLGVSLFATALPLLGLEFKLLALAVVVAALWWIHRRNTQAVGAP